MGAGLKIIFVFVLIIFLMRKKCPLGYAMLGASLILGLFFRMPVLQILEVMGKAAVDRTTLELAGILIMILILSKLLQETGQLRRTVEKLKSLIGDSRIILAGAPAMIGLLPMIGGAVFSAPMVEEAEESGHNLDAVKRSFVNYWFRHIWEYVFPLYPGIILAAKIAEVELRQTAMAQLPLTITALVLGMFFGLLSVPVAGRNPTDKEYKRHSPGIKNVWLNLCGLIIDTLPVTLVILLTLVFKIPILFSLGVGIIMTVAMNRLKPHQALRLIKKEDYINAVVLIMGIMVFRKMLAASGAMAAIAESFLIYKVPLLILIMVLPFLVGIITGVTVAFVGICYPILLSFISSVTALEPVKLNYLMLAFACGFAGVLLSPVHVCLILTRDYFKADAGRLYRTLSAPVLLLVLVALMIFFIRGKII